MADATTADLPTDDERNDDRTDEPDTRLHHDREYFDSMFETTLDPWGFETSWYERRKFALTVAALPKARYRRCLEPGCATGTLTELLSDRCDSVVAYDFVPSVVRAAEARFADRPQIEIVEAEFPTYAPAGTGDLAIWSEVGYYLTDDGFTIAATNLERWLEPNGNLVAVHYTGGTDYPRPGRDVAAEIDQLGWLRRLVTITDQKFELVVWERVADA